MTLWTNTHIGAICKPVWSAHAGKGVEHEHTTFLLWSDIGRQYFAWHTHATCVTRLHLNIVACTRSSLECIGVGFHAHTIIPVAIVLTGINHVVGRFGCRFEHILCFLPTHHYLFASRLSPHRHFLHRQWLNNHLGAVLGVDKTQHTFVYRTGDSELHAWI